MTDDDLRALLRGADPSRGKPPLDETRVRRVVAAAERDALDGRRARPLRHPRRLFAGVSLGAVAAAAGGVFIAGLVTTPVVQATAPPETVACTPPDVESLGEWDTAYEATVMTVSGEDVALQVTAVYLGAPGPAVTVSQEEGADGGDLFVTGRSYLVVSADDDVSRCDSGPATAELRDLYARAFGPPSPG